MLLWSLHPKYLDNKGLGGLWFEGIIARNSLLGVSQGWHNHPQLNRFKQAPDPIAAIDAYLLPIYEEGIRRGFHYNRELFGEIIEPVHLPLSAEQLEKEYDYLLEKLRRRDTLKYVQLKNLPDIQPHPIFEVSPALLKSS